MMKPGDMCSTESNVGWELPGAVACRAVHIDHTKLIIVLASIKPGLENWCYVLCGDKPCWIFDYHLTKQTS